MSQKPTIGRIVIATIKNGRGELVQRPALIVRTWGEESHCVQAQVFTDGQNELEGNDGLPAVLWKSSLQFCETPIENSWNWPMREMPLSAKLESSPKTDWVALHKLALELCYAIEQWPASEKQTALSIKASELAAKIQAASIS
jgi:hypothetical protein